MILTGKCKEAFEKWYFVYLSNQDKHLIKGTDINYFNLLTFSMQYGVYLKFFDSLSIYDLDFSITNSQLYDINTNRTYKCHIGDTYVGEFKTRQEAQIEAIKKANDIFNAR